LLIGGVDDLLTQALLLDLATYGCRQLVAQGIESDFFEDLVALVVEIGDGVHLHVISIQVLEELLHPVDRDLVVRPPLIQQDQ
jgi:hypothetical protein